MRIERIQRPIKAMFQSEGRPDMTLRTLRASLERLGFDTVRLSFTLRTAFAACCAVLIAWLAGLEHPQWSGMTVWAASQPMRGHLLEKSAYRALGTILGVLFGIGLLIVSAGQPWVIATGLSLWIGLCAGAGNILRGFASYGAMLAGYSAAMVALLHSAHSASPLAVGIDRLLTVLLGVLVALAIGWVFATRADPDDPARRARQFSGRILRALLAHLDGSETPGRNEHYLLLREIAAIENGLDNHAAGSFRSRDTVRAVRHLLLPQVALLLWMRRPLRPLDNEPLIAALREAAEAYGDPYRPDAAHAALHRAAGLAASDPVLRDAFVGLATGITQTMAERDESHSAGRTLYPVILHRDWIGAREAMLRASAVTLAVGAAWLVTGWDAAVFMLLGAAIMMTVFSTADHPVVMMRQVLVGQSLGVTAALVCRWLAWPLANGELGLVLWMMPFIFVGGFLFAHRRVWGPVGFDYSMVVLLLLQPAWPLAGSFMHSLTAGVAVILGPTVGWIAFLLIFPVSPQRRLRTLVAMMVREIETMAGQRDASHHRPLLRARFYHRILQLVSWGDKIGTNMQALIDRGFALLLSGSAVLHIDEVLQRPQLAPETARRLNAARARLRKLGEDPQRATRALAMAARLRDPAVDTDLLREAAVELSQSAAFISRAETPE